MERLNGGGILINLTNIVLSSNLDVDITDSEILKSLLELYPIVRDESYKNQIYIKQRASTTTTIIPCSYAISKQNLTLNIYGKILNNLYSERVIRLYIKYTISDCDEISINKAQWSICGRSDTIFKVNIVPEENQNNVITIILPRKLIPVQLNENGGTMTNSQLSQVNGLLGESTIIQILGGDMPRKYLPCLYHTFTANTSITFYYFKQDGTIDSLTLTKDYHSYSIEEL